MQEPMTHGFLIYAFIRLFCLRYCLVENPSESLAVFCQRIYTPVDKFHLILILILGETATSSPFIYFIIF